MYSSTAVTLGSHLGLCLVYLFLAHQYNHMILMILIPCLRVWHDWTLLLLHTPQNPQFSSPSTKSCIEKIRIEIKSARMHHFSDFKRMRHKEYYSYRRHFSMCLSNCVNHEGEYFDQIRKLDFSIAYSGRKQWRNKEKYMGMNMETWPNFCPN